LRGVLAEQHGVPLTEVRKMDIKKGTFVVQMNSGAEHRFALRFLKAYRHPGCGRCRDFACEMADISAGGLGIGGWTVTLVRTEAGEAVMRELEVRGLVEVREMTEFPGVVDLLRKACLRKQGIG
jgi:coenzyme F420 hydrogenase subunit beta